MSIGNHLVVMSIGGDHLVVLTYVWELHVYRKSPCSDVYKRSPCSDVYRRRSPCSGGICMGTSSL